MYRLITIFFILLSDTSYGQSDSTIVQISGPEVHIVSRIESSHKLEYKPSSIQLSDIIAQGTGLQIQGQGGSYLRTALYRGQSARHVAILWEGVNIQNQFNGTYDLGLLPTNLFKNSKWYDGGHSSDIGNSAMSGALVLNDTNNQPYFTLASNFNDQDNASYYANLNITGQKVSHSIGFNLWDHVNSYRYYDFAELKERSNSRHDQIDINYTSRVKWNDNLESKISYWFQDVDRSLPPSTISATVARQADRNHRFSISNIWQLSSRSSFCSSLTYMNEYLGYSQPGINSESRSDILNVNVKWKLQGAIDHTIGINVRNDNGALVDTISPSFQSFSPERTTSAVFYQGQYSKGKSKLNLSIRQEIIDNEVQIPIAKISLAYKHSKNRNYWISASNNFNYPGFNDLYWPLGGNPKLGVERSYQLEFGADLFGVRIACYVIQTTDKIVWAPNEMNIWTPENIASTRSTGIDLKYQKLFRFRDFELTFTPILIYNRTINTAVGINKDNKLLYNPDLNTRLNINMIYKDFSLSLDHSYTDQRFQSLDNKTALDAYQLLNSEIRYKASIQKKYETKIYLGIKNILDQSYELVRYYPQALRSIYTGIKISIQ